MRAVGRRWLLASTLGVICAACAGAAAWRLTPYRYETFAKIEISSHTDNVLDPDQRPTESFAIFRQRQVALVRSAAVLAEALRRLEIPVTDPLWEGQQPLDWLKGHLGVQGYGESEITSISLSGQHPQHMASVVNAVVEVYLKHANEEGRAERRQELEKVEEHYLANRDRLQQLRGELRLRKLHADLLAAESELEAQRGALAAAEAQEVLAAEIEARLANDPQLRAVQKRADDYEVYVAKLARTSRDEARIEQERTELERRRLAFDELRESLRSRYRDETLERNRLVREEAIRRRNNEVEDLRRQRDVLWEELQQKDPKLAGRLDAASETIDRLDEEQESLAEVVRKLAGIREVLRVTLNGAPRIKSFELAPAAQPSNRSRHLNLVGMAILGSLGLVVLGVALIEFHSRRLDSTGDIASLGITVVGALPSLPSGLHKHPMSLAGPTIAPPEGSGIQRFMESVDAVRTLLLRESQMRGTSIIMITSADALEGKTTLATHLGISLSRAGRKTLLVDCDLRRPMIHRLFGLSRAPGLGDVLRATHDLAAAVRPTPAEGLWALTAGQVDREVFRALAQEGLREVLRILRTEYDFILVDTPPALPVADALLVGQQVDATLLSVLRHSTQGHRLYATLEKLAAVEVRVLGAVLQGVSRTQSYRYERHYRPAPPPKT